MGILLLILLFSDQFKLKKKLWISIIIIALLFTNPFLYRTAVLLWQPSPFELKKDIPYEAGILLGGFSGYDKQNHGFFNNASDRFTQTVSLYHQGIIKKIIITGGNGFLKSDQPAETVFAADQLLKMGVPREAILLESNSRNTYENAIFTKRIVDSLQITGKLVLITSAEHMPRSEKVFKKAGFDIQIFPCDYDVINERLDLSNTIAPDTSFLVFWKYLLKEIVGTWVYQLTGKA